MFLDAPHTSNLRWSCLALIALSGCDALTQFDFELDEADMKALDEYDSGIRMC